MQSPALSAREQVLAARDLLIRHRLDYETACREFRWPRVEHFNFALDWFDAVARTTDRPALRIVSGSSAEQRSFKELASRSNQVANFLRDAGIKRGDRVLL